MPIKPIALRKFDIPLEVKSGVIGRLSLTISTIHFRSEPWLLKISDLLVVLGPPPTENGSAHRRNYDVEYVEKYELAKKEAMLEELERFHKSQLLMKAGIPVPAMGGETSQQAQQQWWGASLISSITHNIQVILDNVHVRYEEGGGGCSDRRNAFNFGLRIERMAVCTTNSQWVWVGWVENEENEKIIRLFRNVPTDESNSFKRLEVKGLSVYWNTTGAGESAADGDIEALKVGAFQDFKKGSSDNFNKL